MCAIAALLNIHSAAMPLPSYSPAMIGDIFIFLLEYLPFFVTSHAI